MRNSELLRFKIQLASAELAKNLDKLWDSPDVTRLFPEFLILMHQVIRASVPLMENARAKTMNSSDALSNNLTLYFDEHVREEEDHDEWTLQDLETAGFDRAKITSRMPSHNVAALVGSQYYWINHYHPVTLLGYIAVLEGSANGSTHIHELMERVELPSSIFRTYLMHSEVDVDHKDELYHAIDDLPLEESHISAIGMNGIYTAACLGRCVSDILNPGHSTQLN